MDDFTGSLDELQYMDESERKGITQLCMGYQDLDSLTEVMKLTKGCNFTKLDFEYNQIRDFTPLKSMIKGCSALETLMLGANQIEDLTILKDILKDACVLSELDLSANFLENIKGLSALTESCIALKKLNLSHNPSISDWSGLEDFLRKKGDHLEFLNLSDCPVDVDELARGLSHCTALKELQLIRCNISDLTFFTSLALPHLEELHLTENKFSTLEPLRKLFTSRGAEMKTFMVHRTAPLADITCLIDTVHLWKECNCINFSSCKIPPAQAANLLTEVSLHCNKIRDFCLAQCFSADDIKAAMAERDIDITDELSQSICRDTTTVYLKTIKELCTPATDSTSATVGMKRKNLG